jgi:magnesium transporter
MASSRIFLISHRNTIEPVATLAEALQRRQNDEFLWFDFADPSEADLTALAAPLTLHPLAIEDCLNEDQVPKMEEFPGHTFILFNRYRPDNAATLIEEINFFLGEWFLVSVHSHQGEDPQFVQRLDATVRRDLTEACQGPDFLLQILLDDIVDEKFLAVEALQDQLDATEDELLLRETEFQPAKLIHLRRTLLLLRKSLVYEREVLVKICRRDSPHISEQAIYAFRDIYDHLARFFEVVEICREMVSSIMEIHLSMINNRMSLVANRTNNVMRRLTLITTVFMPLTLLAGIGGMSEWSMMTGPQNWPISYSAFLLGMVVIGMINYYLLRRSEDRDWVRQTPPSASEPREGD